jgi:hypothetical protein
MFRETDKFKVTLVSNQYFYVEVKNDAEFEVEDLVLLVQYQKEIGNGNSFPVLIYPSKTATTNSDLIRYMAQKNSLPYTLADAFVLTSVPQKILARLYFRVIPPERPVKFFSKKEDALEWLQQFFA